MNLQHPIAHLFATYGETIDLIRAGAGTNITVLFAPLDNSSQGIYFDANEQVGLLKPAGMFYQDGAASFPANANDVFFRDGRLWTVRKTQSFRIANTVAVLVALCD